MLGFINNRNWEAVSMGHTSAVTSAVKQALDELSEVLQPLPLPSREWGADPTALHQAWTRLNGCLHDAAALIKKPQTGQGLESIWLRAVCRAVGDVEAEIQRCHYGWDDVLRRCDSDLRCLVYDLPHAGEKLISGTYEGKGGVSQLLEPDQPPLKRLRDLAAEWTKRFQSAPNEPDGFVLESILRRWEPWGKLRDAYVKRAGVLILQAVDSVDVEPKLLHDRNFLREVVHSLDGPEYLPRKRSLTTGDGLLRFIEGELEERNQPKNANNVRPTKPLPVAENSATDRLGPPIAESPNGALKLFGPQHPAIVSGVECPKLTSAQYDVLFTLCQVGASGLNKRDLIKRSKRQDAVGVIDRLAKKGVPWSLVIQMAEISGGRYRLT